MREHSPGRRLLALAAAYVVALQLVLLPLGVAASMAQSAPLCSELAAGQSGDRETNRAAAVDGCGCASGCGMQCCASSLDGPLSTITTIDPSSFAILAPATMAAPPGEKARRGPQNPRAPPPAAA